MMENHDFQKLFGDKLLAPFCFENCHFILATLENFPQVAITQRHLHASKQYPCDFWTSKGMKISETQTLFLGAPGNLEMSFI